MDGFAPPSPRQHRPSAMALAKPNSIRVFPTIIAMGAVRVSASTVTPGRHASPRIIDSSHCGSLHYAMSGNIWLA